MEVVDVRGTYLNTYLLEGTLVPGNVMKSFSDAPDIIGRYLGKVVTR